MFVISVIMCVVVVAFWLLVWVLLLLGLPVILLMV